MTRKSGITRKTGRRRPGSDRSPGDGDPILRLREPSDVLSAIPYLLGFHPEQSIVVLAMAGTRLLFAAREDLPAPEEAGEPSRLGERLVAILSREEADSVVLVGYGSDEAVRPAMLALRDACEGAGVRVRELLRAEDGRYWSYFCNDPACCPAEGCRYDPQSSTVAAAWILAGRVALPNRAAYEGQLEPVQGHHRLVMAQATARASDWLFDLVTRPIDQDELNRQLLHEAHQTVHQALLGLADGQLLADEDAAKLSVLLTVPVVRDAAWEQIGASPQLAPQLRALWLHVMRRAETDYRSVPAALYAYAACQCGDGHLARVALEHALQLEPGLRPAQQLWQAVETGLSPRDLAAALDDSRDGSGGASGSANPVGGRRP